MITVAEAFQIVQSIVMKPQVEEVEILSSVGRVLAESVTADRDFPPFNRVSMDGIAIQSDRLVKGHEFFIEGVQAAGSPPLVLKDQNNCVEVMTGSVLPGNTNAVIRYEDIEVKNGNAKILLERVEAGMNIHPQGQDARKGHELIKPGQRISAAEVALLASVGKKTVRVFDFPKTAVISSGDELVEVDEMPQPHQIRKSNSHALQAAMKDMGWKSESFHLVDDQ